MIAHHVLRCHYDSYIPPILPGQSSRSHWNVLNSPCSFFKLPWLVEVYIAEDALTHECSRSSGLTPLICDAEMGSLVSVKLLLDSGVDPNIAECDGWTPLH